MAALPGIAVPGISNAESFTVWAGFYSPQVTQGLPVPDGADHNPSYTTSGTLIGFRAKGSHSFNLSDAPTTEARRHPLNDMSANLELKYGQGIGFDWFERIHVFPVRLDLGNVVSTVIETVTLYNAYRTDARSLVSFTNNAGAGISVDLPPTPANIPPETSVLADVTVSPDGPPTINGTLDFTFDVRTASVPITGTRIILFDVVPTGGVQERLEFKTDIIKANDGTEQRLALRRFPRQRIRMSTLTLDNVTRNKLNAFLTDWHTRVFAVPEWWDSRALAADVAVSDTTIAAVDLSNADFREGGLAVMYQENADGSRTIETLGILSIGSPPNSITFSSPVANDYTAGVAVIVPAVPGILNTRIPKGRFQSGNQTNDFDFLTIDNEVVRTDLSGYRIYNGRPVIEDLNFIAGRSTSESFNQKTTRLDGETGEVTQLSSEDRSVVGVPMQWEIETAAKGWQIRNFLHTLYGMQVSFYLPTWEQDMVLKANISSGGNTFDIQHIGFTQFMKSREPYNTIRFSLNNFPDYTTFSPVPDYPLDRQFFTITGSAEVDATTERITIAESFIHNINIADVDRIDFIVKSRLGSDAVEIDHNWNDDEGQEVDATVRVQTLGVYDG